MTETKRDVFDDLVEELANAYIALDGEGIGDDLTNEDKQAYLKDYDAALPDDLPVIPEEVGEYIRWCKSYDGIHSISEALYYATESNREWIYRAKNSDAFARAWLLGVWRVEETGEIVKLEAEK
ncbi:Hypothetical protein LOCK919_2118 [Lacticaseibacillus paracasei]|jgi:hypothetical protein|uniref:DUF1642 domain-containing protein n=1 Tax=Lacticaseibacillus paracasei TaxID=1597 RepID=UPI0003557F3B|nr:DUF1642 domain-containing protein [Lacticaseibacillus paracasei]AGP68800.1 Hypothetical protein LOCK919_2118 [Lacticaseibacillus paracasei]